MSHAPYQFLKDAIKILQIKGGELKSHTKCAEHGNDIKNRVKDILCNRNFYENCQIITSIFHPLKVTVRCLELRTSSFADCYIHLLSLANAVYRNGINP
ncbi:2800_t:CDS:2, partial [Rhizophagus irregularis]